MSHAILVALDQGTTSSRAVVFDTEGRVLATHSIEFKAALPPARLDRARSRGYPFQPDRRAAKPL